MIEHLASDVFLKVKELRGSISAEHEDGLARSRHIKEIFGVDTHRLFVQFKKIFDKKNIMNPEKKCCPPNNAIRTSFQEVFLSLAKLDRVISPWKKFNLQVRSEPGSGVSPRSVDGF